MASFCLIEEKQLNLHNGVLVLDCFFVLGLVAFAGCVWKSHRTSQKVNKRQGVLVAANQLPEKIVLVCSLL